MNKNKLISTERALNENELDEDQLNLAGSLLNNVLLRMELPNCFGLYGNWGTGKTSFMNAIRKLIKEKHPEIKSIFFEPWKYEYSNHKDLLFALLSQIKKEIGNSRPLWKKLLVNSCAISSGLLRLPGSIEINATKFPSIEVHNTIKDFKFFEKSIYKEHELWIDKVESFKEDFKEVITETLKKKNKKRLFIFIDDLDRCLPENTVKLIEGIKNFLVLDGTQTLFVFAIDRRVVSEMIEKKYGLHSGYGDEYLTKIIHYYYELPVPNLEKTVKDIFDSYKIDFERNKNNIEIIIRLLEIHANEPRIAKHLIHRTCISIFMSNQIGKMEGGQDNYFIDNLLKIFIVVFLCTKYPKIFSLTNPYQDIKDTLDHLYRLEYLSRDPNKVSQYKEQLEVLNIEISSCKEIESFFHDIQENNYGAIQSIHLSNIFALLSKKQSI